MKILLNILALLLLCGHVSAQTGVPEIMRKVGTQIDSASVRGLDRRYIDVPEKPWQIIARGNISQGVLGMKTSGTIANVDYQAQLHLKTEPSCYVGLWAGYRDYGHLFNDKRFSYAAAYGQSALQKRSAGSLMAGAMYYYGSVNYASPSNGDLIYMMKGLGRVKLWQGSIGMGYAYNWVPARGLLVNVMAMPILTVVNKVKAYGYATNVEELLEDPMCWDDDIDNDEWDEWFYGNLRI